MQQSLKNKTKTKKKKKKKKKKHRDVVKPVYAPQYFNIDRSKAVLLLWFLTVTCFCCPYLKFGSPIMWVTYLDSCMTSCLGKSIALRMSYSTKINLSITTHHCPPEDKNQYACMFTHQCSFAKETSRKTVWMKAKQTNQYLPFLAITLL